jgi:tRNA modification GTPase
VFASDDTIVAVATPPGRGAIGVVRLSGPRAHQILEQVVVAGTRAAARVARLSRVRVVDAAGGETHDDAVALRFDAPHSYTGEDVVEISAHGNPLILDGIVRAAMRAGARLAEPGEFTLRAFLNGKVDLPRAEAVADLIAAATPAQARAAADQLHGTLTARIAAIDSALFDLLARLEASLDFPDEGYHFVEAGAVADALGDIVGRIDMLLADAARGRLLREGATLVIGGRPNVGKSSLFNALVGTDRAIVTSVPGTTRDLVAERVDIEGVAVTLVDTAGARATADPVEREGVSRGARARGASDLVLVVIDRSEPLTHDDQQLLDETRARPRIVVTNKSDCEERCGDLHLSEPVVAVSAQTGSGLPELREAIVRTLTAAEPLRDTPAITNVRHVALLEDTRAALDRARSAASASAPEEFIAADVQQARERLDEIVGRRTSEDVLRHIFERFCIGK